MAKQYQPSEPLQSWAGLNAVLMTSDRALAERLLKEERAHKRRKQFMLRLHSRINKLRADEERAELLELAR